MKVSEELKKEIGNAFVAYGSILHSALLGLEVPSKFEKLKTLSEEALKSKASLLQDFYRSLEVEEIHWFTIYQEGFMAQGMDFPVRASYIGNAKGIDFLDACKNYIKAHPNCGGEIKKDQYDKEYAANWGCRWYPTMEEASRSFG